MIDLSAVPFVDGHMHPPLRVRPQTVEEYRWPWFEGLPAESAHVTELVPYRWAIRQLADELGCAADERSVVAATRGLDPPTWLATVCERSQTIGLVVDTGYPPPGETLPLQQIRAAGVEVAPLLRLEAVAGDLIAEGLGFTDLIERYDAAVAGARDAGYAGLKSIAAYRSGLAIRPWEAVEAEEALARQRSAGITRVQEQALVDFLLLRALPVAARDDLPVQLHAGYGDRDLDLRLVNPLHLRGMLSSEAGAGRPLRRAARSLAVRARGRLPDRRLRQRHARRRDLHSAARARRPARGLALRARSRCDSAACTPRATPPACPSTSRSAPPARARRSARCSPSWSRPASSRRARPSAADGRSSHANSQRLYFGEG